MADDFDENPSSSVEKFKINISEIAELIKISDQINADISEGRRLLLIAINMGKTSKNFNMIAKYLNESKTLMENAIEEALVIKLKEMQEHMEIKKKDFTPDNIVIMKFKEAIELYRLKKYDGVIKNINAINDLLEHEPQQPDKSVEVTPLILKPVEKVQDEWLESPIIRTKKTYIEQEEPVQLSETTTSLENKYADTIMPKQQTDDADYKSPIQESNISVHPPMMKEKVVQPTQEKTIETPVSVNSLSIESDAAKKEQEQLDVSTFVPHDIDVKDEWSETPIQKKSSPPEQPITTTISPELCKCAICLGKIKPGFKMIKCKCSITYHEMCGKRNGKCTSCGASFS